MIRRIALGLGLAVALIATGAYAQQQPSASVTHRVLLQRDLQSLANDASAALAALEAADAEMEKYKAKLRWFDHYFASAPARVTGHPDKK